MSDEELARATVDCRRCKAIAGTACTDSAGNPLPTYEGGLIVHPARLHDWQQQQGGFAKAATE